MTIRQSIQRRGSHAALLWRQGIWGKWIEFGWGILYAGWGAWRAEFIKSADSDRYQIPALIAHLSPLWGWVIAAVILVGWIFEASFKAVAPLQAQIHELKKVDRWDLTNMMGGMFFNDTYAYPAGFVFVKKYDGRLELESLKANFDRVHVRAPRRSWATMGWQFLNREMDSTKFKFYLQDGDGKTAPVDDIYGKITVLLDDDASFGLKMVTDENFVIDETASLLITIEAWTK